MNFSEAQESASSLIEKLGQIAVRIHPAVIAAGLLFAIAPVKAQDVNQFNYLTQLNQWLTFKQNDLVYLLDSKTKVSNGQGLCQDLSNGITVKDLDRRIVTVSSQFNEPQRTNLKVYAVGVQLSAIQNLCPQHKNQLNF